MLRGFLGWALIVVALPVVLGAAAYAQNPRAEDDLRELGKDIEDAHSWQEIVCTPQRRLVCNSGTCEAASPVVHIRITRQSPIQGTMSRCDHDCDTYPVNISSAGLFTSVQPVMPRGTLVKVMGARKFIEIATIGLEVHYSSGECARMC
jgi:hypothetical protein